MRRPHHASLRSSNPQGTKPPWWPESEPWPPPDRSHHWRAGRARFFRRVAAAALAVTLLGAYGALTLVWSAANNLGLVASSPARNAGPVAVVFAMVAFFGALIVFRGMTHRVARPLRDVMDAAERVADGDYSVRVAEYGPPPIRGLARAFNTMTERLQRHDRQRRDLMSDVAHELRTPLTVIQGKLEGLLDDVYPRDDRHLTELLDEAHVLSRLVEDLRTLALSDSGALKLQKESVDIAALTRDVVRTFTSGDVRLGVEAPDELPPISLDPVRIREVLTNLLSNALRHTPRGGSVTVRVTPSSSGVQVDVQDTGSGMTAEELACAFDRFQKGPASGGAGLGLSIARSLVAAHDGAIRASSVPGRGTTMTITLPRVADVIV